jgi:hypothetical protein
MSLRFDGSARWKSGAIISRLLMDGLTATPVTLAALEA